MVVGHCGLPYRTKKQPMKNNQLKTILVTGDRGYIGSVLVPLLLGRGYEVRGYDCGYFTHNRLDNEAPQYFQITKDIRDVQKEDLKGIDGIIHLAGLSNDPLGEFSPDLTEEINYEATINLAKIAKEVGVSRFVYASSQSMYGVSETDEELDEENSEKNPLTAYAATKWKAEQELHNKIATDDFIITSFRPSTVFGASPRLRCDIIFNNLLACAYTTGKIEIKSDGSPWRPVIHVKDVCSAFMAGLEAPPKLVSQRAFNVGLDNGNFTVYHIAQAVQKLVPQSKLSFTHEHTDSRTYKVSFKKILTTLKDYYKPEYSLERGGGELLEFFREVNFKEESFRGRSTIRLKQLLYLKEAKQINHKLKFIS